MCFGVHAFVCLRVCVCVCVCVCLLVLCCLSGGVCVSLEVHDVEVETATLPSLSQMGKGW